MERYYCMIIGDIVNSREIPSNDRYKIQERLKIELEKINFDYDCEICSRFIITLGDEFQGGLFSPYHLFDILKRIKRSIKPYRMRFGIGVGYITTHMKFYDSFGSDGPAYHLARKGINELKSLKTSEYGYRIYTESEDNLLLNSLCSLIDNISSSWTETQKNYVDVVSDYNCELTQIATKLDINISTLSRTLSRANYKFIKETIEKMKKYLYNHYAISNKQGDFIISYNKACKCYSNGDYIESIKELSHTNPISEIDLLNKCILLAMCYTAIGKNLEAVNVVSPILENLNPEYIHKKIRILNIIGINCTELEQLKKAENSFKHAIELVKNIPGTSALEYYTLGNYARLYSKKEEYKKAEEIYLHLLTETSEIFDCNQINKIKTMSNLGALYTTIGEHYRAYRILLEALNIAESFLAENSRTFLVLKLNLAAAIINIPNVEDNESLKNKFRQFIDDFLDCFENLNHMPYIENCYNILMLWEKITGEKYRIEECKKLLSLN